MDEKKSVNARTSLSKNTSPYYVLKCMAPLGKDYFTLKLQTRANRKEWAAGLLFSENDEDEELQPPNEAIALVTQPEANDERFLYAELYWDPIPLFSRRLVTALQNAGVDNLQAFETTLATVQGKNPPPRNHYVAVNIIGRVAAADLAESELNPDVEDRILSADFYSLTVDHKKTKDLLMFRLAENISAVLVHERIKAQVEAAGITTLTWIPPTQWAG